MPMKILQHLRYANWKRILAIFFSTLALFSTLIGFVLQMIDGVHSMDTSDFIIQILNFVVIMLVAYYLLDGNVRNSNSAYRGVLSYVFIMALSALFSILEIVITGIAANALFTFLYSSAFVLALASSIVGFILYRKIVRYLSGDYITTSYKNVVVWTFVFMILCLLSVIFLVVIAAYGLVSTPYSVGVWGGFLTLLGQLAFPIAIFITVLRLRH